MNKKELFKKELFNIFALDETKDKSLIYSNGALKIYNNYKKIWSNIVSYYGTEHLSKYIDNLLFDKNAITFDTECFYFLSQFKQQHDDKFNLNKNKEFNWDSTI